MAEKDFIERNYAASEQTVKPEIGNIQYESPAVNDENHPLGSAQFSLSVRNKRSFWNSRFDAI